MAAALVLATASPEVGHCLTACGPSLADGAGCGCSHDTAEAGHHDGSRESSDAAPSCAGPSCLCHQSFSPTAAVEMPSCLGSVSVEQPRPSFVDLGVVREVAHVPRQAL